MTLRIALAALLAALRVLVDQRDGLWAYRVCGISRDIHLGVALELPENAFVVGQILPALESASKAVKALPKAGEYADFIEVFAHNIRQRIGDLQVYVAKGTLEIRPGDRLQDPVPVLGSSSLGASSSAAAR